MTPRLRKGHLPAAHARCVSFARAIADTDPLGLGSRPALGVDLSLRKQLAPLSLSRNSGGHVALSAAWRLARVAEVIRSRSRALFCKNFPRRADRISGETPSQGGSWQGEGGSGTRNGC